jgi:hypothetical protein
MLFKATSLCFMQIRLSPFKLMRNPIKEWQKKRYDLIKLMSELSKWKKLCIIEI